LNAANDRERDPASGPAGASAVIHVPHAATLIPGDVREQLVLNDEEIVDELRLMTDHLTDELFAMPEAMAIAPISGKSSCR
jgi:N-formylglutamate deformylase